MKHSLAERFRLHSKLLGHLLLIFTACASQSACAHRYEDQVACQAYLVTKDRLFEALPRESFDSLPAQTAQELADKEVYLVVKVTNNGNQAPGGTLHCKISRYDVPIDVPFLEAGNKKPAYYIVRLWEFIKKVDTDDLSIHLRWSSFHAE